MDPVGVATQMPFTEELLEKSRNRADIVVEIGWVAEVEVGRVVVESVTKGVDV